MSGQRNPWFRAMLVAALGGVILSLAGWEALLTIPLAAVMAALALGVLRSYRRSRTAVIGLVVALVGLAVLMIGLAVPAVAEFADSTPLAVAIEAALVGLAVLALGAGRASRRPGLLAVAGISLPLVVGVVLTPVLEAVDAYGDGQAWLAGLFAGLAFLAVALHLATPPAGRTWSAKAGLGAA